MELVLDTSSLISLAWAGQLGLIRRSPMPLQLLTAVHDETVREGLAAGHADAAAIEAAVTELPRVESTVEGSVDQAVVAAAQLAGAVLTNDQALGRRAVNVGSRWLRTADFVILLVRTSRLRRDEAAGALSALHDAGRLTDDLYAAYRQELA